MYGYQLVVPTLFKLVHSDGIAQGIQHPSHQSTEVRLHHPYRIIGQSERISRRSYRETPFIQDAGWSTHRYSHKIIIRITALQALGIIRNTSRRIAQFHLAHIQERHLQARPYQVIQFAVARSQLDGNGVIRPVGDDFGTLDVTAVVGHQHSLTFLLDFAHIVQPVQMGIHGRICRVVQGNLEVVGIFSILGEERVLYLDFGSKIRWQYQRSAVNV